VQPALDASALLFCAPRSRRRCTQLATFAFRELNRQAQAIMQWLSGSAAALWAIAGSLSAGVIALLAVWMSNKNSRRQLAMQLFADKQQRERDRNMAVRRDVYIPAAEGISRIQNLISELADFTTDQSALSRHITTDLASLAKVSVLGTDATVFAISRLTAASMLAYLQLTTMRQKLLQRRGKLQTAVAARDSAVDQRQQIARLFHQAFKSGTNDSSLLRRLQTQLESDDKAAKARQSEVDRLLEEHTNEERELHLRILEVNQEILKHVPDALIAVRRELELPINEAVLRRFFAEQQTSTLEVARRVLDQTGTMEKAPQMGAISGVTTKEPKSPVIPEERPAPILAEAEATGAPELH
jgi:hypothetical protein